MGETEVRSPISRRGSAAGSGQPLSQGARSNPSRGDARQPGGIVRGVHAEPEPPVTKPSEPAPATAWSGPRTDHQIVDQLAGRDVVLVARS